MSVYFLLSIVVLNITYVLGYFLIAILLKVKEAHYFLGYNAELFSFHLRDTKFSIGFYIPIIGLAQIHRVVDGKKERARYAWEFFEHTLISRLMITLGGAISLFVFGVILFIGIHYFKEDTFISKAEMNRLGIYPSAKARVGGFQKGDQILLINGKNFERYEDLFNPETIIDSVTRYTVLRNGQEIEIKLHWVAAFAMEGQTYLALNGPYEVQEVLSGSPAAIAGILPDDKIVKVNGQPVGFAELSESFQADDDGTLLLEIQRPENDQVKTMTIQMVMGPARKAGIRAKNPIQYSQVRNNWTDAVQKGVSHALHSIRSNVKAFMILTTGQIKPSKQLRGPIGVTSNSEFIFTTTTASAALMYALWNLLPLPKSAFWELVALGYERLRKRTYSFATFMRTLKWSWAVLIGLMIWILTNDILKFIF